jgi:lipoprotein-anchoring transpeptidase ErfK/SrfK
MRRILVSALLVSASCLPALADPIQLIPSAFATHERAGAGAAVQARPQSAASGPRYVEANQPHYGGGFIELLFGGGARQLVAPRAYQPAAPDGGQPAQVPIALNMPMQGYAPSAFGNMAHPPIDPKFERQVVAYHSEEKPGTIVIDTPNRFLYLVAAGGKAMRYGIGVGRPGFTWAGVKTISAMREWPDWRPPDEMIERRPDLPRYMAGGPENPLGARAMYLGSSLYRIHGSNEPWTIGSQASSGCIRMRNEDVTDLYDRVKVGTKVVVM